MERVQKVIANNGYCSRRKAEELIKAGKVRVNGEVVRELGTLVDTNDTIEVDGFVIDKAEKIYTSLILNYFNIKCPISRVVEFTEIYVLPGA